MRLRDLSTKKRLSNISRRLKEDQSLIKTEDQLSRNLDEDFTDPINREIRRLGASKVPGDMVIAIDPGDIRKKYAKKMGFLGRAFGGLCGIIWPVGNVTSRIVPSSSVTSHFHFSIWPDRSRIKIM